MPTPQQFTTFVQQAGDLFFYEDFLELEIDPEDIIVDELGYSSADIVRDETNEVFRFCIFDRELNLAQDLPLFFDLYRDLENEDDDDEFEGAVILFRGNNDDDFWYVYRTESEEIALFHSDLSNDDNNEDEDEDDEADEDADEVSTEDQEKPPLA
jgi:hypothetical protein